MTSINASMRLFVVANLVHAANTIDGPKTGEVLSIILEKADGARYAHPATFPAFDVICDESTDYETRVTNNPQAMTDAEALIAQITSAASIDLTHWTEIQPAYGSQAYIAGAWEQVSLATEMRAPF